MLPDRVGGKSTRGLCRGAAGPHLYFGWIFQMTFWKEDLKEKAIGMKDGLEALHPPQQEMGLSHQLKSMGGPTSLHACSICAALSSCGSPNNWNKGHPLIYSFFNWSLWLEECIVLIAQARFIPRLRDELPVSFSNSKGGREFYFKEDEDKKDKLWST